VASGSDPGSSGWSRPHASHAWQRAAETRAMRSVRSPNRTRMTNYTQTILHDRRGLSREAREPLRAGCVLPRFSDALDRVSKGQHQGPWSPARCASSSSLATADRTDDRSHVTFNACSGRLRSWRPSRNRRRMIFRALIGSGESIGHRALLYFCHFDIRSRSVSSAMTMNSNRRRRGRIGDGVDRCY